MKKRISCLVLCVILLVAAVSFSAYAVIPVDAPEATSEPTISEAYIPSEAPTEPVEEVIVLEPSVVERVETTDLEILKTLVSQCETRIAEAENMANAAIALGYEESHPVIILAQTEKLLAEEDLAHYKTIVAEEERKIEEARAAEEARRLEEQRKAEEKKLAEQKAAEEARKAQNAAEYPAATQIWNYLKSLGYNDHVCAGIMGNIMAEVGGQTLNIRYSLYDGTGYYYGICQWNRGNYGEVHGTGLTTQLNFLRDTIKKEFNTFGYAYRSGFDYQDFLNLTDEREAALAFAKVYERCGSSTYNVRKNNATKALEYFAG